MTAPTPTNQPTLSAPTGTPIIPAPTGTPTASAPVGSPLGSAPSTLPATDERLHVHNSYIWLGGLRLFGIILFAVAVGSLSSIASLLAEIGADTRFYGALMLPLVLGGILVLFLLVLGIVMGARAWSYKHLWYEVGPEEFSLYSGILNKKRVHVPYQRIQSVDQVATLMQRIFGVCSVSIDTAGGSANKAIIVPYVTKSAAETLRRELFARKQWAVSGGAAEAVASVSVEAGEQGASGTPAKAATAAASTAAATANATGSPIAAGPNNILDVGDQAWRAVGGVFAGPAVEGGAISFEYGLSNKELLLSGLSNGSGFTVIVLAIFAALTQLLSGVFELVPETGDVALDVATSLAAQQGVSFVVGAVAFGIIVAALVIWVLSALSACLSYGGFHARRRGDRIEVERGLLQHQSQSVSVQRVQSVMVKQSFIRRLIGYCEISLGRVDANVNNEEAGTGKKTTPDRGIVIHPFVKKARVPEILNGLIPEFADLPSAPGQQRKVAHVGLRRGLIRRCIWQGGGVWLAVCVLLVQATMHWGAQFVEQETLLDYIAMLGFVDLVAGALYVLAGVLFILDIIGTVLWFRGSSFGINDRFMEVTNSGFAVATVAFPRKKIQFGYTKTNPFQRLAHTASIHARTAAGVGGTTVRLVDAAEADANAWLDWVKPRDSRQ